MGAEHRLQTVGSVAKSFLYDGADIVQEFTGATASAALLTGAGIDERFTRTTPSATSIYLTDAQGSPVALADSTGAIQINYGYDPYGNATATGATNDNAFQYTGRENDGTGLYYYRARYYNPAWGRFISEDPMGLSGGINLYRYARSSPLMFGDPFGLRVNVFVFGSGTASTPAVPPGFPMQGQGAAEAIGVAGLDFSDGFFAGSIKAVGVIVGQGLFHAGYFRGKESLTTGNPETSILLRVRWILARCKNLTPSLVG